MVKCVIIVKENLLLIMVNLLCKFELYIFKDEKSGRVGRVIPTISHKE